MVYLQIKYALATNADFASDLSPTFDALKLSGLSTGSLAITAPAAEVIPLTITTIGTTAFAAGSSATTAVSLSFPVAGGTVTGTVDGVAVTAGTYDPATGLITGLTVAGFTFGAVTIGNLLLTQASTANFYLGRLVAVKVSKCRKIAVTVYQYGFLTFQSDGNTFFLIGYAPFNIDATTGSPAVPAHGTNQFVATDASISSDFRRVAVIGYLDDLLVGTDLVVTLPTNPLPNIVLRVYPVGSAGAAFAQDARVQPILQTVMNDGYFTATSVLTTTEYNNLYESRFGTPKVRYTRNNNYLVVSYTQYQRADLLLSTATPPLQQGELNSFIKVLLAETLSTISANVFIGYNTALEVAAIKYDYEKCKKKCCDSSSSSTVCCPKKCKSSSSSTKCCPSSSSSSTTKCCKKKKCKSSSSSSTTKCCKKKKCKSSSSSSCSSSDDCFSSSSCSSCSSYTLECKPKKKKCCKKKKCKRCYRNYAIVSFSNPAANDNTILPLQTFGVRIFKLPKDGQGGGCPQIYNGCNSGLSITPIIDIPTGNRVTAIAVFNGLKTKDCHKNNGRSLIALGTDLNSDTLQNGVGATFEGNITVFSFNGCKMRAIANTYRDSAPWAMAFARNGKVLITIEQVITATVPGGQTIPAGAGVTPTADLVVPPEVILTNVYKLERKDPCGSCSSEDCCDDSDASYCRTSCCFKLCLEDQVNTVTTYVQQLTSPLVFTQPAAYPVIPASGAGAFNNTGGVIDRNPDAAVYIAAQESSVIVGWSAPFEPTAGVFQFRNYVQVFKYSCAY